MSVRNPDAMFRPGSIAVIGASRRLRRAVMPVNPKAQSIGSTLAYRSVKPLLAAEAEEGGRPVLLGTVRIIADLDNVAAEYGILVRSNLKGQGLGYRPMIDIIACARSPRLERISAEILRENATMLRMAGELGFECEAVPEEPGIVRATIALEA